MNYEYFNALIEKFHNKHEKEVVLFNEDSAKDSNVYPFALLDNEQRSEVQNYADLSANLDELKNFNLILCKMHAGIGSSVERKEHLLKYGKRKSLGSKGTDLFLEVNSQMHSLAELQLLQAEIIAQKKIFHSVRVLNLVNEETSQVVDNLFENVSLLSSRKYIDSVIKEENLFQFKFPTMNEKKELDDTRIAPAGHAYLGFNLLYKVFSEEKKPHLISIGNGEDINSSADNKILSWVAQNNIPITMITTTKLKTDKKGGQISKVFDPRGEYLTIVEKAQAEKAHQLKYFEELGLRAGDNSSLFNTNIVIVNTKALKEVFEQINFDSDLDFFRVIAPELIKNTKKQKGESFTQLEGALGSSLLNLDKFLRLKYNIKAVTLLNLSENEREKFFLPIKKMDDFNELAEKFKFDLKTGRLRAK